MRNPSTIWKLIVVGSLTDARTFSEKLRQNMVEDVREIPSGCCLLILPTNPSVVEGVTSSTLLSSHLMKPHCSHWSWYKCRSWYLGIALGYIISLALAMRCISTETRKLWSILSTNIPTDVQIVIQVTHVKSSPDQMITIIFQKIVNEPAQPQWSWLLTMISLNWFYFDFCYFLKTL
jgi:hypothetical protein